MKKSKNRNGFLAEIASGRTNLIEILLVAIFIAFGVNLVVGSLPLLAGFTPRRSFILGMGICLISLLYLVARLFGRRTQCRNYEGFFIYHIKNNEVVLIPRYDFSEYLVKYINAAFFENKALKAIWDKEPLRDIFVAEKDKKAVHINKVPSYSPAYLRGHRVLCAI